MSDLIERLRNFAIAHRADDRVLLANLEDECANAIEFLLRDRNEWRTQHENLGAVRATDIANLNAKIKHLTAENAALRADAGRYFTLELLAANGDVRIAFDEDGRIGVHLEEAAECADGSWFGDDLAAAVDAATRQITDTDAAIDAAIDSGRNTDA